MLQHHVTLDSCIFILMSEPTASGAAVTLPRGGRTSSHPQETLGDQHHCWGLPSLQFIPPLAGHSFSSSLQSPSLLVPVPPAHPGSCLERSLGLLVAPIPSGKSHSLPGSQRDGRFETAPRQPRTFFFILDFLLPALPGVVAQPHPSVVEPLVGRSPVLGVTVGHFKLLFPNFLTRSTRAD